MPSIHSVVPPRTGPTTSSDSSFRQQGHRLVGCEPHMGSGRMSASGALSIICDAAYSGFAEESFISSEVDVGSSVWLSPRPKHRMINHCRDRGFGERLEQSPRLGFRGRRGRGLLIDLRHRIIRLPLRQFGLVVLADLASRIDHPVSRLREGQLTPRIPRCQVESIMPGVASPARVVSRAPRRSSRLALAFPADRGKIPRRGDPRPADHTLLDRGVAVDHLGRIDDRVGPPRRSRGASSRFPRWPGGPPTAPHIHPFDTEGP